MRAAIVTSSVALALAVAACSGGERSREPAAETDLAAASAPSPGAAAPTSVADLAPARPTTSIGLVDMFPAEADLPVVPASDAHDAMLPPGVLPDDFAIVVRARIGAAPFVELRPRAGMPGRWELVAADAEVPEDPSEDLSESLVWSVEVPVRRVAGLYAFVRGHDDTLSCGASTGIFTRYSRRSGRVACDASADALALRARLDQLVADFAP